MPIDTTDDKTRATFKRLLLAKQLYLHGLDHSKKSGSLNKMVAVHNFHNAIEIALRAIFLYYEIRAEKTLNIDFESMLSEIDNFPEFKANSIKLPYRQEVRNLNQIRNLVQHHAVEPETATMEDWRVFTKRFLEKTFEAYFALEFQKLSALDMIDDQLLKKVLEISFKKLEQGDEEQSLALTKLAFDWGSKAILDFLPQQYRTKSRYIEGFGFYDSNTELYQATYFAALLSTGINLVDYKQFLSYTPNVYVGRDNVIHAGWVYVANKKAALESAQWANDFVVTTIVHWQVLGLLPCVPEREKSEAQRIIEDATTKINDPH